MRENEMARVNLKPSTTWTQKQLPDGRGGRTRVISDTSLLAPPSFVARRHFAHLNFTLPIS